MKHQLHIVYIITKLELGGAQKVCLTLLNGLKKHNVHTMLISGKEGLLASEVASSHDVCLLDEFTREVHIGSFFKELICLYRLTKKLKELRSTYPHLIVHTHSTKAGLLGRWAAFFARVPYRVHTIHGYGFHQHQKWYMRSIIICLEWITSFITNHYVCVSSADAKTGVQQFPAFNRKHSIIRAAVDWQQFYMPARRIAFPHHKPFVFGTVSCFKKQKNLFDMLKAFAWVHQRNKQTRLEIIGDGILQHDIITWIEQHTLQSAITLHGWQQSVAPLMLNWHAFLLSSLWEGLPCAIIEARLLKLPVLSYTTGGIHDVIIHGQNGLLFKQQDWMSLAQGMQEIASQDTMHNRLSSYNDDLGDFKSGVMIEQHLQLYQSLIHTHH